MKVQETEEKNPGLVSRRGLLRSATAAAIILGAGSLGHAANPVVPALVNYGKSDDGKTELVPETIFPLFAAWLLFTTNGPFDVDETILGCAAHIHPETAKILLDSYNTNAAAFKPVRKLFEDLAKQFSGGKVPYSGGQCPKIADTVAPVATLFGTPTPAVCGQLMKTKRTPSKPK